MHKARKKTRRTRVKYKMVMEGMQLQGKRLLLVLSWNLFLSLVNMSSGPRKCLFKDNSLDTHFSFNVILCIVISVTLLLQMFVFYLPSICLCNMPIKNVWQNSQTLTSRYCWGLEGILGTNTVYLYTSVFFEFLTNICYFCNLAKNPFQSEKSACPRPCKVSPSRASAHQHIHLII